MNYIIYSDKFIKCGSKKISIAIFISLIFCLFCSCLPAHKYAYPHKKEKQELCTRDSIYDHKGSEYLMHCFDTISSQPLPATLQERMEATRPGRGLFAPLVNNLLGDGVNAVKTIITNEQNKYTTVSGFAKTDLYFYDQPSLTGPFDPAGMQFTGFDIIRYIKNEKGDVVDTAFIAQFQIDTTKINEILTNSVFRLTLKDFRLKYVKPKVAWMGGRKMSVEFNITFLSSYVNDKGALMDSVLLGKFHCLLRDISIDLSDKNFGRCRKDSMLVTGRSFIVPRSFGYFKYNGKIMTGYNQGQYTIIANVKECTKPIFGSKILAENTGVAVGIASQEAATEAGNLVPILK